MYIGATKVIIFKNNVCFSLQKDAVCFSVFCVFLLSQQTVQTLTNCRIMWHFIWPKYPFRVFSLQRVNKGLHLRFMSFSIHNIL